MLRQRFVTGPDSAPGPRSQLELGLTHAMGLLSEADTGLLMTFYAKGNLDIVSSRLVPFLGAQTVRNLWGTRNKDGPLKIMTERDDSPFVWRGPVLMVYPSALMFNRVGDIRQVTAEIVVPWMATSEGLQDWTAAWSPVPIGAAIAPSAGPTLSSPARVALRSLTSFVNLGNGLVTRTDREEAIHVFETLLMFEPQLNKSAVRAWLVSEGQWPGDVADEAARILDDLAAGKQLRGRRGADKALYDWWTKMAREG